MKKLLLLLFPAILGAQQARTMTRSGAALGDSSLVVVSDTLTSKTTFVTKAASIAQLRKVLVKFTFDSIVVTNAERFTNLTASQAVFTDASKGLVSNAITGSGNVVMSASPTLTGTTNVSSITAPGTVTLTGATVTGAPTWSNNQAITLSTANQPNITGIGTLSSGAVPASLVTSGTFGAGAYTFPSTLTSSGTFTATTGVITAGGANTDLSLSAIGAGGQVLLKTTFGTVLTAGNTGVVTLANGLTVSSGTTAVQALTTVGTITIGGIDNNVTAGKWTVTRTSTQGSFNYDASNRFEITTGSTGIVAFNAVGAGASFTFAQGVTATTATLSTANVASLTASGWLSSNSLISGGWSTAYPSVGYNYTPTAATTFNYAGTDFASRIHFNTGGIDFYTAPSGAAGNAITFTKQLAIAQTGAATFTAGISATTGSLSSTLTFTAASSQVIPGTASFSIRNNANNADNLFVSNAGAVTTRSDLTVNSGVISANLPVAGAGDTYVCLNTAFTTLKTSAAACTGSSSKIKENINSFPSGLQQTLALRPVSFQYQKGFYRARTDIGFIAEEAAKIDSRFAEYATEDQHLQNGATIKKGDPYALNTTAILSTLVRAVQEQQVQIDSLKRQLSKRP